MQQAPPRAAQTAVQSVGSTAAADAGISRADWFGSLGDSRLVAIVGEALQHNSDPSSARVNLQESAAQARRADKALHAAAEAGAGDFRANRDENVSGAFRTASGLGERSCLQRDRIAIDAARVEQAGARESEAAQQSLAAHTARAWLLASEANLQLGLADQALKIRRMIPQHVQQRIVNGFASAKDLDLANSRLDIAAEGLRQSLDALVHSMRSVASVVGRFPSAELEAVPQSLPTPPAIAFDSAPVAPACRTVLVTAERLLGERDALLSRMLQQDLSALGASAPAAQGGKPGGLERLNLEARIIELRIALTRTRYARLALWIESRPPPAAYSKP